MRTCTKSYGKKTCISDSEHFTTKRISSDGAFGVKTTKLDVKTTVATRTKTRRTFCFEPCKFGVRKNQVGEKTDAFI